VRKVVAQFELGHINCWVGGTQNDTAIAFPERAVSDLEQMFKILYPPQISSTDKKALLESLCIPKTSVASIP